MRPIDHCRTMRMLLVTKHGMICTSCSTRANSPWPGCARTFALVDLCLDSCPYVRVPNKACFPPRTVKVTLTDQIAYTVSYIQITCIRRFGRKFVDAM